MEIMTKLLVIVFGVLFSKSALALLPSAIQPDEFAMLPAYCKAKLSADANDDKLYSGSIGPDWLHIHHYCFALNFTNRFYKATNPNDKRHYLRSALDNHDYMFTHSKPDFWMRPEIHTEKAKQLRAAKRYSEAIAELTRAISIKADYWSAYVVLSDVLAEMNKKQEAISTVEKGLLYKPDSKALHRRYKLLTGKDFVPPVTGTVVNDDVGQDAGKHKSELQPIDLTSSTIRADSNQKTEAGNSNQQTGPLTPSREIGSPTNPYCRFCP